MDPDFYIFARILQPQQALVAKRFAAREGSSIIILRERTNLARSDGHWEEKVLPGMHKIARFQEEVLHDEVLYRNGDKEEYIVGIDSGRSIYGDAAGFWGEFRRFATGLPGPFNTLEDFFKARDLHRGELHGYSGRADKLTYSQAILNTRLEAIRNAAKANSWEEAAAIRIGLKQEHPSNPTLNKGIDYAIETHNRKKLYDCLKKGNFSAWRPPSLTVEAYLRSLDSRFFPER